jgi:hypothetical protein
MAAKRNGNYLSPAEYQILKESFERRLMADTDLPFAYFRVAVAIKWHMNHSTGEAWPGIATIMREARVCRRTVYDAIKYFEKANHMEIWRRPGRVNHYFPHAQTSAEASAPPQCRS